MAAETDPVVRPTRPLEKLLCSAVNAAAVLLPFIPIAISDLPLLAKQVALVGLFLAENLIAIAFFDYRLPGMWLLGSFMAEPYPLRSRLRHALFYTASFATLPFWVWFPLDLFLVNMLCLQLPAIWLTGTTLHGWLAGGMVDLRRVE